MEREEHKKKLEEVLNNLQDQGKVTEILAELTQDYSELSANIETLNNTNKKLVDDAESLRNANMKLFLQIGNTPQKEEEKPTPDPVPEVEEPKKLNFEDLFNEKGGLK